MNKCYFLKNVIYKLTALLMAVFILFSTVACAGNKDDENAGLMIGTYVGDMLYMSVARVEFVGVAYYASFASCASESKYEFRVKEVLNLWRSSTQEVYEGGTITFIDDCNLPEWLENNGYVYEEGKEYVIAFIKDSWEIGCYIPLYDLDKCCELIKEDSEYFGFSLDVPPDEFVAELKEVIVTLKAYYNGELSELPFLGNDDNK